jgi:hypothetical protein
MKKKERYNLKDLLNFTPKYIRFLRKMGMILKKNIWSEKTKFACV